MSGRIVPGSGMTQEVNWLAQAWSKYAVFEGRARRREYWTFTLANWATSFFLIVFWVVLEDSKSPSWMTALAAIATIGFSIAVILPQVAVTVRRLHDCDLSGWLLFVSLVPFVGGLILFVLMMRPGTAGNNRFGPNPKQTA